MPVRPDMRTESSDAQGPRALVAAPDVDPLCSLYLIGQQSGLAKANPLPMHNKTLIRNRCKAATLAPSGQPLIPPMDGPPERFRTGPGPRGFAGRASRVISVAHLGGPLRVGQGLVYKAELQGPTVEGHQPSCPAP